MHLVSYCGLVAITLSPGPAFSAQEHLPGAPGATTTVAAAPATSTDRVGLSSDSRRNEMVCERVHETGSRLRIQRVCVTRAEWDEQHRVERQNVEHAQTNRIWPG